MLPLLQAILVLQGTYFSLERRLSDKGGSNYELLSLSGKKQEMRKTKQQGQHKLAAGSYSCSVYGYAGTGECDNRGSE